jgi:RNA polymerase sigma-70 factor (ECF subfamily)
MVSTSLASRESFTEKLDTARKKWNAAATTIFLAMMSVVYHESDEGEDQAPLTPNSTLKNTNAEKTSESDRQGFSLIFNELYTPLTLMAKNFVKDLDVAEDIVMEVFCQHWEKRHIFHNAKDIKAFLYVSVRNRCYDFLRHQQVVKAAKNYFTHIFQAEALANSIQEMESEVGLSETVQQIHKAINSLPKQYQQIVQLTFLEDKSIEDAAQLLGKSYQAIVNMRFRALKKLKINLI